ncbi:MAG: GH92 family glycosyl hydrolase, partial [bacterium]|nr:GH92 family glycosyl hydrolase [bacterium]
NALAYARASASEQYTVFSLWYTFRAAHPLYTIIDQKRTVDYINSFLRIYEQGGRLPVWELWGEETDTMIGYHSVSVIADAMAKGIEGFDYEKAYAAAKYSANLDHHGLAAYKKRGYVSGEDDNESVSKTLEYAYNDWCIAQMAKILLAKRERDNRDPRILRERAGWDDPYRRETTYHLDEERRVFLHRARFFENLFDPETTFFRPKRNGSFVKPFAPNEVTFHFTEGNSWQYSFFTPHDVTHLIKLMGGRDKFVAKLDELFTTEQKLTGREQPDITGLIGQYAHGNEPSHHIPYLYNYAGAPSKTQARVRYILDNFYKNSPDGLIGNEDCGQMSAWYVLSASGFYSTTPGQTSYDLGTPIFKEVKFNLENGKTFAVRAPNVSEKNFFVRSVKWNGKTHRSSFIRHEDIMKGGVLEFEMTNTPNDKAFTDHSRTAISQVTAAVPIIEGQRVFKDKTTINIKAPLGGKIHWKQDGTTSSHDWRTDFQSFEIAETTTVRAYTVDAEGRRSKEVEAVFAKRSNDWTVKLNSEFNSQYPGSSYDAIIDGLRGNQNFAAGEWQGYWGKPFEAVIDLQRETEIREVGGSFLQSARSWIWMPDRLSFEVSNDGTTFTKIADWKPEFPQTEMSGTPKEFLKTVTPVKARYVRVCAFNFGKIPSWHLGAGGDPWIFVDEIFIR